MALDFIKVFIMSIFKVALATFAYQLLLAQPIVTEQPIYLMASDEHTGFSFQNDNQMTDSLTVEHRNKCSQVRATM